MFVQPFVKLGYNQINYNNARDNYGKKCGEVLFNVIEKSENKQYIFKQLGIKS